MNKGLSEQFTRYRLAAQAPECTLLHRRRSRYDGFARFAWSLLTQAAQSELTFRIDPKVHAPHV